MDEGEEVAMCMAGDIARSRRSVDFRRRGTRIETEDSITQTDSGPTQNPDWLSESYTRMRKQTTVLCSMGCSLVIANVSQLRFTLQAGDQHRHYGIVVGLLVLCLVVQCCVALLLLYVSKKEADKTGIEGYPLSMGSCNILIVLLTLVSVINIIVFVLV